MMSSWEKQWRETAKEVLREKGVPEERWESVMLRGLAKTREAEALKKKQSGGVEKRGTGGSKITTVVSGRNVEGTSDPPAQMKQQERGATASVAGIKRKHHEIGAANLEAPRESKSRGLVKKAEPRPAERKSEGHKTLEVRRVDGPADPSRSTQGPEDGRGTHVPFQGPPGEDSKMAGLVKSFSADMFTKVDGNMQQMRRDLASARSDISRLQSQHRAVVEVSVELLEKLKGIMEMAGSREREE